jgi:hypothetical protein
MDFQIICIEIILTDQVVETRITQAIDGPANEK